MESLKGMIVNVTLEKNSDGMQTVEIVSRTSGEKITLRPVNVETEIRTLILDLNDFLSQTDSVISRNHSSGDIKIRMQETGRRQLAEELKELRKNH